MSSKQLQKPSGYRVRREVTDEDMTFDVSMFRTNDTPKGNSSSGANPANNENMEIIVSAGNAKANADDLHKTNETDKNPNASVEQKRTIDKDATRESSAERKEREEIDRRIETLYPSQYEESIPLNKLVPAPADWNFFPQPDKETMQRLMQSILDYGVLHPAIVWEQDDGTYMLLGGHTRFRALRNLLALFPERASSLGHLRCNVYAHDQLDENDARRIIIMDNTTQRQKESRAVMIASVVHMGELMKNQRAGHRAKRGEQRKRINDIIAESLGVSGSTVKGIMRFRTLLPEFLPLLNRRTANGMPITQAQAQAIASLPTQLQKEIFESGVCSDSRFPRVQAKDLVKATNIDEVNNLMKAPEQHVIVSRTTLDAPLPPGYSTLQLAVRDDEYDKMLELLISAVEKSESLSNETKKIAEEMLMAAAVRK